jgi:hypothetical protein
MKNNHAFNDVIGRKIDMNIDSLTRPILEGTVLQDLRGTKRGISDRFSFQDSYQVYIIFIILIRNISRKGSASADTRKMYLETGGDLA